MNAETLVNEPQSEGPAEGAGETTVQIADELAISDLDVLRVLSDKLRLQLIEAFGRTMPEPRSVKDVAKELGQSATKLYYHVNLLEENGLLIVGSSQLVSGIVEKRYLPAAKQFRVDRRLLQGGVGLTPEGQEAIVHAVESVFESAIDDLKRSFAAGHVDAEDAPGKRRTVISRSSLRLTRKQAVKVAETLAAILATPDNDADEEAENYGLMVAFYPRGPQPGKKR